MRYLHKIFPWFHNCIFIIDRVLAVETMDINNNTVIISSFQSHCNKCGKSGIVISTIVQPKLIMQGQSKINNAIDKLGLFKN